MATIVPNAWRLTSKTVIATGHSAVKKAREKKNDDDDDDEDDEDDDDDDGEDDEDDEDDDDIFCGWKVSGLRFVFSEFASTLIEVF